MIKKLEFLSLAICLGACISALFYLITKYSHPIFFTEPNPFIRIPEIVLGLFSIPFMIKLMIERLGK